jgi:pilus assembly protein Flp/PilA
MREPYYETRDGFQVRRDQFNLPSDSTNLDPKTKRAVTICNLFINHRLTVSDIARVLDEKHGAVISALINRATNILRKRPSSRKLIEIRFQGVSNTQSSKEELTMFELIKRFIEQEEGQDLVEYALLLVFIALIVIAALPNLGKTVSNVFSNATSVLQSGS